MIVPPKKKKKFNVLYPEEVTNVRINSVSPYRTPILLSLVFLLLVSSRSSLPSTLTSFSLYSFLLFNRDKVLRPFSTEVNIYNVSPSILFCLHQFRFQSFVGCTWILSKHITRVVSHVLNFNFNSST